MCKRYSEQINPDMKAISKKCPRCGRTFSCFQQTGKPCWCEKYLISPEVLVRIREKYHDCLCPDCLPEYAENVDDFSRKDLIST